jgi:uncharacterized protein (TIRG00374 family)
MLVRIAVGLGLIVWLAASGAIDWTRLFGLARAWPLTVGAVFVLFLTVVLTSWRLCMLLAVQGLHLPVSASLRLTLIGALFSNVLPGSSGGDLVRVYLAARPNAGRRTEIATTLIIDRVIGLLALLTAPLVVALAGRGLVARSASLQAMVAVSVLAVAAVTAVLFIGAHPDGVVRRLVIRAVGRSRAGLYIERAFESIRAHRRHGRVIARAFILSLVIQGLVIAAIQLILMANGNPSVSWGAAMLTPFGMLANALPLTPGGLGVGEAAFESLFRLAALTGGAEAILSWRVLTTVIDLCGGVILIAGRTDAHMTLHDAAGHVNAGPQAESAAARDA